MSWMTIIIQIKREQQQHMCQMSQDVMFSFLLTEYQFDDANANNDNRN